MKKYSYVLIFFLLLLIPINTSALVSPSSRFYINDYANILSAETEDYIFKHSNSLNSKTTSQIVVVTVSNLEGNSLEEYATELFRSFGIGSKNDNNGLLILLSLAERKVRVEVGYGLEGILNDAKTGRIQDEYMIPFFKENNFDEGMLNGYKAFYKEIVNYYGVNEEIDEPEKQEKDNYIVPLIIFILYGTMFLIFIFNTKKRLPFIYVGGSRGYRGFSSRGSSFGGHFGGGGRSGGGGSSRRF